MMNFDLKTFVAFVCMWAILSFLIMDIIHVPYQWMMLAGVITFAISDVFSKWVGDKL